MKDIVDSELSLTDLATKYDCSVNLVWRVKHGYAKGYYNFVEPQFEFKFEEQENTDQLRVG